MSEHLLGRFDVMVLGTGPGGEGAAMKCAKAGRKVAAVERFTYVGGGCTHWGTIPSKALRRAIYHANVTFENPAYRRMETTPAYSFPDLLATAQEVIEEQTELRRSFYDHNGVQLIPGEASFVDPHTIEVLKEDGARERFGSEAFVIATGSRPFRPPGVDFAHPRIRDSDSILQMDFTPRSVLVYGAGVIGCEYASMFARMRMDVTLINTRDRLLAFLDNEIIAALAYHFADLGIRILHNEEVESITGHDDHAELRLKSGKCEKADVVLWANGRTGNSDRLALDRIDVTPTKYGQIAVNELLQVVHTPAAESGPARADASPRPTPLAGASAGVHPHIFAVGDIIGQPSLASASYDQGRFAGTVLVEAGQPDWRLIHDIPTGIYTLPEISSLGKTEEQLTAEKIPYEVGKAQFKHLARAQITHVRVGMLKLCFHRETFEILGIHCFGESAAEIIHIGQAIMSQPAPHNTLHYFTRTTFNYPTMAEAYRVAALNGLDRL